MSWRSLSAHYFATVWTCHSLFIQSPVAGLSDYFQSSAITSHATTNKGVMGHFASVQVHLEHWFPEAGLLNQMALKSPSGRVDSLFSPTMCRMAFYPTAAPARSVSALFLLIWLVKNGNLELFKFFEL